MKRRATLIAMLAVLDGAAAAPSVSAGGWRTQVSAEPVAARDPRWSVIVQRLRQQPATVAALTPGAQAPSTGGPVTGSATEGLASYYWQAQTTASGERFDPKKLTAAHRSLPFNTLVRVVNPANGRSVVVRINDRGPFKPGRIIDLAEAAAEQIGMRSSGIARVKLEVLSRSRLASGF